MTTRQVEANKSVTGTSIREEIEKVRRRDLEEVANEIGRVLQMNPGWKRDSNRLFRKVEGNFSGRRIDGEEVANFILEGAKEEYGMMFRQAMNKWAESLDKNDVLMRVPEQDKMKVLARFGTASDVGARWSELITVGECIRVAWKSGKSVAELFEGMSTEERMGLIRENESMAAVYIRFVGEEERLKIIGKMR